MPKKLSAIQFEVIAQLRKHGQPLVRWPGGFWTYKGYPVGKQVKDTGFLTYNVPEWSVSTHTMRAMTRRGLLARSQVHDEEWRDERVLTIEALKVI